ncbi:MAG: hypothetical protein H6812_05975 [Phycisphaeraceae bacterium]|nr:hypothetical protein [Phycisphaerales bacterium]MCB9842792.1 hypothetical protein [Phycisphaeraceae bacterium]
MADAIPQLKPLIISAPFGNYVQPEGCTATLGTFTAARRPGRVWRVIRTVRYYPRLRAWVNKIGLRNPGIGWLVEKTRAGGIDVSDKIVSVHGFTPDDWWALIEKSAALKPLAIELNISCPNVGELNWPGDLFTRAVATGVSTIVKLPPVNYELAFDDAMRGGVRTFHCCNTLPVPAGGVSGKPLMPVALQCIRDLRLRAGGTPITIIGGGGITTPGDIDAYRDAGADHFAIGTKVMHPKYLWSHRGIAPLVERASLSAKSMRHNAQ